MAMIGGWRIKYKKRRKPKSNQKKFNAYYKRNDRLSELGYAGYEEYLKSDDWKAIRDRKLMKFPSCLLCKRHATQVHHTDYSNEVLLGLETRLLVTLCEECHKKIEFDNSGNKRSLREANASLKTLAAAIGLHRWLNMVKGARESMARKRKLNLREKSRKKKEVVKAAIENRKKKKQERDAKNAFVNPPNEELRCPGTTTTSSTPNSKTAS